MLVRRAEGIWTHDIPHRVATISMGARSTFVQTDAGLVLHSPVPLDEPTRREVATLGEVRWIVAPSLMHYAHVPTAKAAFPEARVYGAPGLRAKKPTFPIDFEPGDPGSHELESVFPSHLVAGMPGLNELVFLHAKSRTLVATDLFFHMHENDDAWSRGYFRLNRAWKRPGHTIVHRLYTRDRAAVRSSIEQLLAWDFDRVIIAHGSVVETGGKDAIRTAFAWV